MKNKTVNIVVSNELCTGCGTCNIACPAKAIEIKYSPAGRLLPSIDDTKCIKCGLCLKVCPGADLSGSLAKKIDNTLFGEIKVVNVLRSTNKEIFANAQSGGAVTETLSYLFDKGTIDAALIVVQESLHARYKVVCTKQQLIQSQTSQYTPVDLISGLTLLENYKHVAVVGLPCHIEGIIKLRELHPSKYNNIDYLLGLICAGTLSQLIVDVVKTVGKKRIGVVSDHDVLYWRHKKYSNYESADIAVVGQNGEARHLSNQVRHMSKPYLTAPRCHLCFDKLNLYSDIVYGDAWGINGDESSNGANVVIARTAKGVELLSSLIKENRLEGRSCSLSEVSVGQGMKKKQETVGKMIGYYKQKSFIIPGWANDYPYLANIDTSDPLSRMVDDYIKRETKGSGKIVREVSNIINRRFAIMDVKRIIKKLLNYK